ncbi:MAG: DUF1499 domain-containing protein [Candidatus Binatia bacterium]
MAKAMLRGPRSAFLLATAAVVAFVSGPLLAHFAVVPPMVGFGLFAAGGLLGTAAVIVSIVAALRGAGMSGGLAAGAVVTAVFFTVAVPARRFPPINDITTDTVNPPQFASAQSLAGNVERDMSYPGASFAAQQRTAYPDLAPLRISATPEQAFKRVEAAARRMSDWDITRDDAGVHALEGVATSRLFHFKDDFVIEVRAQEDVSVVQMRSKSRDGRGDIGANAARIKGFLATLR